MKKYLMDVEEVVTRVIVLQAPNDELAEEYAFDPDKWISDTVGTIHPKIIQMERLE